MSRTKNKIASSPGRCVHIFAVAVAVHMFVCSRAWKGVCDRDGQGQVRRLPFVSHGWGQSSSPRYRCVRSCSSVSSQVIMFLLLSCTVEGESRASHTRSR